MRSSDERWQPGNYEQNIAAIDRLTGLAQQKGASVTQLALAENVGAADVTLTADDLRLVDEILPGGSFGSRYAEANMPSWERG